MAKADRVGTISKLVGIGAVLLASYALLDDSPPALQLTLTIIGLILVPILLGEIVHAVATVWRKRRRE